MDVPYVADFTAEARDFAERIDSKIVLIDEYMLANLMIDNGVGVSLGPTYEVTKIDTDYLVEE